MTRSQAYLVAMAAGDKLIGEAKKFLGQVLEGDAGGSNFSPDRLSPTTVVLLTNLHYKGGWPAFVRDHQERVG